LSEDYFLSRLDEDTIEPWSTEEHWTTAEIVGVLSPIYSGFVVDFQKTALGNLFLALILNKAKLVATTYLMACLKMNLFSTRQRNIDGR
jgi:hypothetical protein